MEGSNSKANFEGKKTTSFSTESVTPCNMSDPDKNYFNDKLQETDFPYFSFENFRIFFKTFKRKSFFCLPS